MWPSGPIENPGTFGKNLVWGSEGAWGYGGGVVIVNILKRIAQQLRKVILFYCGLVTFLFHFGDPENP